MGKGKFEMDENIKQLIRQFRFTWRNYEGVLDKSLVDDGIYKSQFMVLVNVYHHEGISQTELAKKLDISPPSVAVTVKKLVNLGYITRVVDAKDNRINLLSITETGRQKLHQTWDGFCDVDVRMFEGFSVGEQMQMLNFFERMHENLEHIKKEMDDREES